MPSEPSLPWDMALSIGMISWPRTSPTITRSGDIRSPDRNSAAMSIAPSPSTLASRACNGTTSACGAVSASRASS